MSPIGTERLRGVTCRVVVETALFAFAINDAKEAREEIFLKQALNANSRFLIKFFLLFGIVLLYFLCLTRRHICVCMYIFMYIIEL